MGIAEAQLIRKPLLIVFERDGGIVVEMWPSNTMNGHADYGILICDLVRHAALAFGVPEREVWKYVDVERKHPSGGIETIHVQ